MSPSAPAKPAPVFAEIHAPCFSDDAPLPPPCRLPGHEDAAQPHRYRGHCRVTRLPFGGHLLFGAQRPVSVAHWLQVGPARPTVPSPVSAVAGHLWISDFNSRLMVENVSRNNTLELRSHRLPRSLTLYPVVEAKDIDSLDDRVGTPVVAVQAARTTLILSNQSEQYPIWIEVQVQPQNELQSRFTRDPRRALVAGKDAEAAAAALDLPAHQRAAAALRIHQAELDDAAKRIQLADSEYYALLERFLVGGPVAARLEGSATLRTFLTPLERSPLAFRDRELENIREGKPSHEIHRLILEALGTPPPHASRWYTQLVIDQLEPERAAKSRRGGATGGLKEWIPTVKGHWAFRRWQLEEYLAQGMSRGHDLGRDLGHDLEVND